MMGASTASYMMFTMDKVVDTLMKHINIIIASKPQQADKVANNPDVCKLLQSLFEENERKVTEGTATSQDVSRYLQKCTVLLDDLSMDKDGKQRDRECIFRVGHTVQSLQAQPASGKAASPRVWSATDVWEVQPGIHLELLGSAMALRNETIARPTEQSGADAYIDRYLGCSAVTGFGGSFMRKTSCTRRISFVIRGACVPGCRAETATTTERLGTIRAAERRSTAARNRIVLERHAKSWGLGSLHTSDSLQMQLDLEDHHIAYVPGTGDFLYRIHAKGWKNGKKPGEGRVVPALTKRMDLAAMARILAKKWLTWRSRRKTFLPPMRTT